MKLLVAALGAAGLMMMVAHSAVSVYTLDEKDALQENNSRIELPTFPAPKIVRDNPWHGRNLQRTLRLMAESTPQKRNTVRILVYGQSISQQDWWKEVHADLRRRFPHADLVMENRAIGGFASNVLRRPAEHDLYPFYPDLVIFHVYGGEPDYEALITEIRNRTTAEVLLVNDHLSSGQESDTRGGEWHEQHSMVWLPALAEKLGSGYADIRGPWRQYLKDNGLTVSSLLSDGVHLNAQGNFLMAELIKPFLRVHDKPLTPSEKQNAEAIKTIPVGKEVRWQRGRLICPFEGNRVEVIASPGRKECRPARVLIDGKNPAELGLFYVTRPSATVDNIWPAVIRVGHEKPRVAEDWTLTVTSVNDAEKTWTFSVSGSVTGPDGEGDSKERFVSKSGRVVIEPGDWYVNQARGLSGKVMPMGFQVRWQVRPLFTETYADVPIPDDTKEAVTTLAQDLPNGKHTLELVADRGETPPIIRAIRVYRPVVARP